MRLLLMLGLLGCDTEAATETGADSGADTATDTSTDTGTDTSTDTANDTASDTGTDTGETGDTAAWEPTGNLCGTVVRPADAPKTGGDVYVATVADGETACIDRDTGSTWWGTTVAEPELVDDHFDTTLAPGVYGVEVVAPENYRGCEAVEITDTDVCAHEVLVTLGYEISVDKPNVYLYPTAPTNVRVSVPQWRRITESDPAYPAEGWRVRAFPDGRLVTTAGPRDFLFYELAWDPARFQTEAGWCVPGEIGQATIEDAMGDMGFLPNEIDDFAEGWDESFPAAEWLTVYPQFDLPALVIEPAPDHLLRAWFYVTDGCSAAEAPELPILPRTGWHAAEWGVSFAAPLDGGAVLVEGWR